MNNSENSSMRYLLARLKPFGRLAFWGPLGILSLGLIFYWQYQQHPEWLTQITDQPETLDSYFRSPSIPTNQADGTAPNVQPSQAGANDPNSPNRSNWATEWKSKLSDQQVSPFSVDNSKNLNKNNNTPQTNQNSSLFRPLLPPVKSNNQPPDAVRPYQVQTAPRSENYLKTAVEQIPTSNPSSYYNTNVAPINSGQPVNPTGTGYQSPYGTGNAPSPAAPSYGSTYASPLPPQPYTSAPTVNQQPDNASGNVNQNGYQVQPSISRTGQY